MTERTHEQQAARDVEVTALVAKDTLDILEKITALYSRAVDAMVPGESADRHRAAVLASRQYVVAARREYGVDQIAEPVGYSTVCDKPGCFAQTSIVKSLDLEVVHAAARAEGWGVWVLGSGRSVARCPQHLENARGW